MQIKFDIKTIIIAILVILLLIGSGLYINSIRKHNLQHSQDEKLQRALTDTLRTYKDKNGKLVYEKLTLQADVKDLRDKNITLTEAQKDLLKAVDKLNKDNKLISAAIVQMSAKIDGLTDNDPVEINDHSVRFAANSDSINYDIVIDNVKPIESFTPSLQFKKFELPNTQTVSFKWGEKKYGYPVSFSVTNSNPYYRVQNIESYVIPSLQKEELSPNFWNKLGKFSKKTTGRVVTFGIGVGVGYLLLR